MSNRFIRPDWITYRQGHRQRTDYRFPVEGQVDRFGKHAPQPGFTAVQLSPGQVIVPQAIIDYYGVERLRGIFHDPDMEILAAEDVH